MLEYRADLSFDLCDGARSDLTLLSNPGLELMTTIQGSTFGTLTCIIIERSMEMLLLFSFIFTSLSETKLRLFKTHTDICTKALEWRGFYYELESFTKETRDSFCVLSVFGRIQTCYKTIICPAVLYWRETSSLTLADERK